MTKETIKEGYWYSEFSPNYPNPIPNTLTQAEANYIFNLIKFKEKFAKYIQYRGFSTSRIDGKTLVGSGEYDSNDWVWPSGFAEHYVRDHRVKPSDDFLKFIGYKNF